MKPVFKIGDHDYTDYILELSPDREDLDAEGSGRNLLDGEMYRARIAQKEKWSVKFLRLPEDVMKQLSIDVDKEYTAITLLNPKTNRILTKTYYLSTLHYGAQKYVKSEDITVYDGANFNITER